MNLKLTTNLILLFLLLFHSKVIFSQTAPSTPTGLSITGTQCGQITLGWVGYSLQANYTGFDIYRAADSEFNSFSKIGTADGSSLNYSDNLINAQSGRTYYYKIKGINGSEESEFSDVVFSSFTCTAPENLLVSNTSCGVIDLKWDLIQETNNRGYQIFISSNGENGNYYSIGSVSSGVKSYSYRNYNTSEGVRHFKIKGVYINSNTSDYGNVAVSSTISCPSVTGTSVASSSCGVMNITWNDYPSDTQETGYSIYRSNTEEGPYYQIASVNANITNFTDTGYLTPNQNFYYKVAGRFYETLSPLSSFGVGRFTCQAPTGQQIIASSCGEITIGWDDYPQGIEETGYYIFRAETENGEYYSIGSVNANVLTYTDRSIYTFVPDKVYFYKITGRFNNTSTFAGNFVSSSFSCPVPTGLKITNSTCGSISLSWNDFPEGQNETGYRVYRSNNPTDNFSYVTQLGANVLSYTDATVNSQNIKYYYKIKALFNNVETQFGNLVTGDFTCAVPTGLQLVSSSCGVFNLSWSDYPPGTEEAGYSIYFSESENGTYNLLGSVAANVLTYTASNMQYNTVFNQNQIYYFKIGGKFNNVTSNFSQVAFGSFSCPAPPQPQTVSSTCGAITISWPDFANGINETGYEIYRSNYENSNYSYIGTVAANVLTYTDTGYMYDDQTYYYKIRGKFNNTLTYISAHTTGSFNCTETTAPIATTAGCGNISISWADYPAGVSETGYTIYRATSADGYFSSIGSVNANVLTFLDNTYYLSPNTNYYYKVAGRFNNTISNGSLASNSVSFTCIAPTNLAITSTSCGRITLNWNDYPAGINETGFELLRANSPDGYYYSIAQLTANTTTYIDNSSGLSSDISYYYKVRGKFSNTTSPESNIINANFTCPIPTGITIASAECGSIVIRWTDFPAGTNETGYDILRANSENETYYMIGSVGANNLAYNDNSYNLNSGQTYYYKLRGRFGNTYTGLSSSAFGSFSCVKPTGLTVSSTTCGRINLTWTSLPMPSNHTGYRIYRATSLNGNYNDYYFASSNATSWYDESSLMANLTYYYKIKAIYNNSLSDFSEAASGSFTCEVPTGLTVTNTSCGSIRISWTDYPSPITESGYNIYRATSQNGIYNYIAYTNANITNYTDNNYLNNGQIYYYKIAGRFINSNSVLSNNAQGSFTCEIPQDLQVTGTQCGSIRLSWQDFPSTIQESGYNIYRSIDGEFGEFENIGSVNANITSFVDQSYGLYQGRTYFYKIIARFSNTYSGFSNYAIGSYTCPVPTNLVVSNTICGSITLGWADFPSGTNETGYEIYRSDSENGYYYRLDGLRANELRYVDNNNDLVSGRTYYYKLKGLFNNISTNFSNIVSSSFFCNFNICNSIVSGAWNSPTTWSCGRIPTSLDEILINNGHKVSLGVNLTGNAKNITNNGELEFGTGAQIILNPE